ncbi:MAG: phosphomannomutase/phosphoglucomutase [Desulfovibrionaceae bacterium]
MRPVRPEVFRAYDIRGLVGRDFDPEWAETLGRAAGTWFADRGFSRAVLGHDARHSSPEYALAAARGLAAAGLDVVGLGLVPSPVFYYAAMRLDAPAGIMVTASHNPPEYNGFKLWGGGTTLSPADIAGLRDVMLGGRFASGRGVIGEFDILPDYFDELAAQVRLPGSMTIVVDGGNGAAGEVCAELLTRCGARVVRLNCAPDGDFPAHHPDPVIPENARQLMAAVLEHGAAFGVGLDGDGDRIGVVDETGRLMDGDELTALLARGVLAQSPGEIVIGDVKCSHKLFADIAAHGGRPLMAPTGHSLMKAKLRETGAALAGEMSGHIFFGHRFFGFDDAAYAALRLAELAAAEPGTPLSRRLAPWPATVHTPELRVDCPEAIKFEAVRRLAEDLAATPPPGADLVLVDGVRLTFPDGWGLVRASNTQAKLTLRFEAESAERLAEIRAGLEGRLARITSALAANLPAPPPGSGA